MSHRSLTLIQSLTILSGCPKNRVHLRPSTIKNWRDQGKLDYFQPDWTSRVLYPKETIEDFERQYTKKAKVIEFKKPAEVKREMPRVSSNSKKIWRI